MKTKISVISIVQMLIIVSVFTNITLADENEIQWPDSWILIDPDPAENGDNDDYRDVKNAFYGLDDEYLYFRLECYASPNFTAQPEARYKWFIDIDNPHNMGQSGGNVYDAEYLLFVEDSPKPGGDGIGDIYLLNDVNDDGFFGDDWDNYLVTPGKINDSSIASYRIENNCMDVCIKLTEISNPIYSYFTWATDQENPNLDQAPDIDRSNNYWDTNLSKADISIVKTDSVDPLFIGESFTYSLLVTNHGPHVAYDIQVTDEIPESLIFNGATPIASGGSLPYLFWDIPLLNVSESYIIIIDVTPNISFSGIITNIAVANNGTYDPVAGNNQDTEETTVIQVADLSIKKTASVETLIVGDELNYTLTITNNGPHAAENVVVTDILPADVTFLSAEPAQSDNVGQTYNWNLALLDSGESFVFNISVLTDAMGVIVNTAQVTSDILDQISNNNQDSVVTTVKGIADLSIQKTSEYNAPVYEGDPINYFINVTNHGPDAASDVNVTDILPNGVTFIGSTLEPNGSQESIYWWIIASIDVNESVIFQINVTVDDGFSGKINNTATVQDDSYDPNDDDNEDDEEIIVEDDSSGGGGNPGGGNSNNNPSDDFSTPPLILKDPTAVTGGPYYASVGEEIQFNATESYDNDENGSSIDRYDWKFSDDDEWQNDSGAEVTHAYSKPGRYNISLRVFDDEGVSNINTTFALIVKLNNAPSKPEVTGPQNGLKNVSYNFTFVSTDEDGDKIKYLIDWGDGNTTESDFLPSDVPFSTSYKWINSGSYNINIIVDDNETITTDDLTIEIKDPDPKLKKADKTNVLIPLFLLLLLIIVILVLFLDKRRRDAKKYNEILKHLQNENKPQNNK